jgi:photosystem II stability/assembly factor-like uncharacterized protein
MFKRTSLFSKGSNDHFTRKKLIFMVFFTKKIILRTSLVLGYSLFIGAGCQKERLQLPLNEVRVPEAVDLTGLVDWGDGHWMALGGTRWRKGLVFRTSDHGQHWSVDSVAETDLTRVSEKGGVVVATVHSTRLLISTDSGRIWQQRSFVPHEAFQGVAQGPSGNIAVVGGINYHSGCLYHFPNPGQASDWKLDSMANELYDVDFIDAQTLVATGYGTVARSDDGGHSWQPYDPGTGDMFRSCHFPSSEVGFAVGYYGSIIKTVDGGRHWICLRNSNDWFVSDERFRDVFFMDETSGFIVGENGTFWETRNGGDSWAIVEGIPSDIHLFSVTVQDGVGYLTGSEGKIYIFVP